MKVTLNYFGSTNNNKFGLRKKKILFEENKIQLLSDARKINQEKLEKSKKNKLSVDYLIKNDINKNKDFELIKIKDFNKTKNFNFFNYFQNMKYFNRINSCRRILSSSQTSYFDYNNNNKIFSVFEEKDFPENKNEIKKNKIFVKIDNNKKNKKLRISKIDINKIISNYIQENNNDIKIFNQKNIKINNKMKNLYLTSRIIYKNNNKTITNKKSKIIDFNINKNEISKISYSRNKVNRGANRTNYIYSKDNENKINSNLAFKSDLFNLKINISSNKTPINNAIIISKNNYYYNSNNNNRNKKTKNKITNLFIKKVNSSVDASTNTDFYKMN
jgi:hypothetical protein